ncbi:aminotransferase class III-fold pyridoxal phosphate-dependent enzyme [Jannaschia ovalis]|uniref:Aminotransferase class III-fold pyridoxal phosphate-dependent enzyme n=1 Tax=Jannaschia ovalis TaxID=3038773 RepID=A0ABY8LFL7_9RHOB|nr:aminotransferase class III-fold pyridoxal phosphate-dependent enzyme [Jannaschia sp. GRR-S6-38]WGH79936.1 aminotransferase class III-fold pyridoxal phosphate-dependent enzyme [Jannaschia sp. GRR-S6-38]
MRDHNFLTEMNARHLWHPMAHPGEMQATPPKIITEAAGVRIRDMDGHETIDAVGGLWNVNLGYSCEPIKTAIADQLARLPYYSAFKGTTNDAAIELSVKLAEMFGPDGMSRAFFTSGGSDSVDTALKFARQYHRLRGEGTRTKFIALRKGYHGTHWGGASVNGNPLFREPYEPLLPGCFHVPSPYPYRNPFDEADPERLAHLCLKALEAEIEMQVPSTVAAFIMEPVQGAGGVIVPHESFMPGVREICDRHGVLLIADEVITGFGRTGHVSGSRHWGVRPDLMCLAKAITSGYFPMGAVLAGDRLAEVFEGERGAMIGTGYTYSGHPVGCAAALACLEETERLAVWDRAAAIGARLKAGLEGLRRHEAVGDVRSEGMMCALEIVSDRAARTMDPARAGRIYEATYKAGVMVRWSGSNLVMSPPLILSEDDADRIVAALDEGLSAAG